MYIILFLLSSNTSITRQNKAQRNLGERVGKEQGHITDDVGQAKVEGKG